MGEAEQDDLLRRYAGGQATWGELRRHGIGSYLDVLAGLGRLGLRPPIAPLDGPNAELRMRGRALIREALGRAAQA